MYLDHFGLRQPPFKITPNIEFFYAGGNRGAILDALLYGITSGEGIIKVTGEIGSGKTMLCRMVGNLLPENVDAVFLVNPSLSRDEILYTIAEELGLGMAGQRISMVLRELQRHLIERYEQGHQVVAFLDEAQAIPLDSLEEIRLLSNLETAHHKLLQIVLFGQPELDESLKLPRMRQLKERITHSFIIPPFSRADIAEYLMFRMRAAGYRGPEIFDADAIKLIDAASQGITRRINVLADKALLSAFAENTHEIQSRHMKAAIADSEFSITTPSRLPLKKIGFIATLALLGIGLGIGWQHYANMPPAPAAPAQATQATSKPAVITAPLSDAQTRPTPKPAPPIQPANETTPPAATGGKTAPLATTPSATLTQQDKSTGKNSDRTSTSSNSTLPQSAAALTPLPSQPVIKTEQLPAAAQTKSAPPTQPRNEAASPPVATPSANEKPMAATKPQPATRKKNTQTAVAANATLTQQDKLTGEGSARTSTQSEPAHPQSTTTLTPPLLRQQLDATRAWLDTKNTGHYTIQLMALNEPYTLPQITQILDNHRKTIGSQDIYIYSVYSARTNKHQFRIVLGSFPSREQAVAAIARLPSSYKANRPFRRTIKGVKDEIEQQQH
ncbi:MAG: AAA family ATPase [Sulfuricella sp.]